MKTIVNLGVLRKAVKSMSGFCSKEHIRPLFSKIRLDFDKGTLKMTAVALDGFKMNVEKRACLDIDENFTAHIGKDLPFGSEEDDVSIELKEGVCYITNEFSMVAYKQPEGMGADYMNFIPKTEKPYRIGFSIKFLLDALKSAKQDSEDGRVILEFNTESNITPVVMKTNVDDIKMVLPVRI